MYIVNGEALDESKVYECSGIEAEWLMFEKKLPLLSSTKDGKYYFAKTDSLNDALEEIPFWLKVKKFIK